MKDNWFVGRAYSVLEDKWIKVCKGINTEDVKRASKTLEDSVDFPYSKFVYMGKVNVKPTSCRELRDSIIKTGSMKVKDNDHYYRLDKRKNEYGEFIVKEYINGKFREDGSYYTDDWQDAVDTIKSMARNEGMAIEQKGSSYIAK